jgi:hypothetical protein
VLVDGSDKEPRLAFEEFQLFYESTERVTERRHSANRQNYSICAATVIAVAAALNWGFGTPRFLGVALVATFLLSGMAFLFCWLWIGQIRDFKKLNAAKFVVLNKMAPRISFGAGHEDDRVSFEPFKKEWEELKAHDGLATDRRTTMQALRSTNVEYWIPIGFVMLFGTTAILAVTLFLANWGKLQIIVTP